MKLNLSYFLPAITIPGMASFANGQLAIGRHRLRVLSDESPFIGDERSYSMSMMAAAGGGIEPMEKSSKSGKSAKMELVPAPKQVFYLQNHGFGEEDPTKFNIDLNLELKTLSTADVILRASKRWMKVITGDLSPRSTEGNSAGFNPCLNSLPEVIDDTHICVQEQEEDGIGGFLGFAGGTPRVNFDEDGNFSIELTALNGRMVFDTDDVAWLTEAGLFDDFILRLMAHALRFDPAGTQFLTALGGPAVIDEDFNYIGEKGLRVWNEEWGCVGAPPLDIVDDYGPIDSEFWDEQCFGNELMTPTLNSDGNYLSRQTIAFFDDIGYTVDYAGADDYDGSDTTCCNGASIQASPGESKPPLSESGRAAAIEKGRSILNEMKSPAKEGSVSIEQDATDFGGQSITVLWEENGIVYSVPVSKE